MTDLTKPIWAESRTDPEILSENRFEGPDGPVVELMLNADDELFQFQGHFPNEPIMPGVAQVDWAARFSTQFFEIKGTIQKLGQLKFSRLIKPGGALSLRLMYDKGKHRVTFTFSEGDKVCSSGYLELGPE